MEIHHEGKAYASYAPSPQATTACTLRTRCRSKEQIRCIWAAIATTQRFLSELGNNAEHRGNARPPGHRLSFGGNECRAPHPCPANTHSEDQRSPHQSPIWCFPTQRLFNLQSHLATPAHPCSMPFARGNTRCEHSAPCRSPRSQQGSKLETCSCFFLLFLLEWLHRLSLLVPTLLLSNYFQPQRSSADMVTAFFCMWLIFLPFFFN